MPKFDSLSNVLQTQFDLALDALRFIRVSLWPPCALAAANLFLRKQWGLAEHYRYTRDKDWLQRVAPQMVAGCDFLIRARKETLHLEPDGRRPLTYGLAPAGTIGDPQSWKYSFMLNGFFYLGMKKCAEVLMDTDAENARRIEADDADYLQAIRMP